MLLSHTIIQTKMAFSYKEYPFLIVLPVIYKITSNRFLDWAFLPSLNMNINMFSLLLIQLLQLTKLGRKNLKDTRLFLIFVVKDKFR